LSLRAGRIPAASDTSAHLLGSARRRFFIEGDRVRIIDDRTGQPVLYSDEQEAHMKAAEAEIARLREELARLKGKTPS
jgi:hypothetical protein